MAESRRRLAGLLVAVAMSLFSFTLAVGPASAEPAVAPSACGPGYVVTDRHDVPEAVVYESYNASVGRLCAVAIKKMPGTPTWMCIGYVTSVGKELDCGYYREQAGPVYATPPPGTCVTLVVVIGEHRYEFSRC